VRKLESHYGVLGDAISGAFGGAVLGSLFEVAWITAIVGAIILVVPDIRKMIKKPDTTKAI